MSVATPMTTFFDEINDDITQVEQQVLGSVELPLPQVLGLVAPLIRKLLIGYAQEQGKEVAESEDLLEVFKGFVKGDPSLNSVRDNVREIVYYQNCLAAGREDALPKAPQRMAVRTLRHIYLYLRTRAEQKGE